MCVEIQAFTHFTISWLSYGQVYKEHSQTTLSILNSTKTSIKCSDHRTPKATVNTFFVIYFSAGSGNYLGFVASFLELTLVTFTNTI